MCVTVYKYLIWKDFKEGAIPIGSSNTNELTQSGFEIKSGALKFPPASQPSGEEGMIYYDSSKKKFLCYQDNPNTPQVDPTWIDCGGGGPGEPPKPTFPFQIYDSQGRLVLEINEE
jgi:hypothetical protein